MHEGSKAKIERLNSLVLLIAIPYTIATFKGYSSEVPQPASLRLGLPILRSTQGRFYSSFGLPASSADASTRGARLLELVLLSVHRQTSAFRRRITFTTDSPWNYSTMANQPGFVSSLSSASTFTP